MEKNILLVHEITPNPNSVRIISNLDFRIGGGVTFKKGSYDIEIVNELFFIDGIKELYLFDNFITITKEVDHSWDYIIERAKFKIKNCLPFHDPEFIFKREREVKQFPLDVMDKINKIEEILDKFVRPSLQSDGGDIEIEDLKDGILIIKYTGACSSCPSAVSGTLMGIESIIKNEYSSDIQIKIYQDNSNLLY